MSKPTAAENDVNEADYERPLDDFLQEVRATKNPSFVDVDERTLGDDLLNGVMIGYTIKERSDRELLHRIGRKHGLIPLCPGEVVDIDLLGDCQAMGSFVRTSFGKMWIRPRPG